MMQTVRVRPATTGDAEALAVVHVRTWQAAYRGKVPQEYLDRLDPAERQPLWQQWLRDDQLPGGTVVLEHEADGVVGFINVSPSQNPDTDPLRVGEVKAIYLLPAHWGRGAGRLLMAAGLRRLADAGYREAVLWVLDTNHRARRFYEAGGWRADGLVKADDSRGFPLVELRYRHADLDAV